MELVSTLQILMVQPLFLLIYLSEVLRRLTMLKWSLVFKSLLGSSGMITGILVWQQHSELWLKEKNLIDFMLQILVPMNVCVNIEGNNTFIQKQVDHQEAKEATLLGLSSHTMTTKNCGLYFYDGRSDTITIYLFETPCRVENSG